MALLITVTATFHAHGADADGHIDANVSGQRISQCSLYLNGVSINAGVTARMKATASTLTSILIYAVGGRLLSSTRGWDTSSLPLPGASARWVVGGSGRVVPRMRGQTASGTLMSRILAPSCTS